MDKVVHFEIPADSIERAQMFYSGVFGWKLSPVPEMDYVIVHTVETGKDDMPMERGAINGGMMKRMSKEDAPVIVVNVGSLDASLQKIEKAGGKVVMPKQKVGDMGFYARFRDTEGNVIGVWENIKK